jgi:hypothetical protein
MFVIFSQNSFCTSICLQYKLHVIAVASILLASRILKISFPSGWWKVFDTSLEQLDGILFVFCFLFLFFNSKDICNQVLNLYENPVESDSK